MSVHPRFDNPKPVARLETAPIVLRFASMFPRDLKRREMHDNRTGGDLSHIRMDLSHLNTQLDLSRLCAAPSARLGHFPFEGDRAFP
uniref:hypothetical protein n=1 Tax=Nioella nitratireducens TaxID=1287720 RepID=UPI001F32CECA